MKKRVVSVVKGGIVTAFLLACLLAVSPQRAHALLGLPIPIGAGLPVFDGASFGTLTAIWSQDISTFLKIKDTFDLATQQAINLSALIKGGWRTAIPLLASNATPNRYGETALWGAVMNGQLTLAPSVWTTATFPVMHDAFMAAQMPDSSATLATLASIHAVDGAAVQCMQTVAQYSQDSTANLPGVMSLSFLQADDTPATNSNIEQLNMINGHQDQANNEMREQGAIAACLAQQQTIANKIQRDQLADALDFQGEVYDNNAAQDFNWGGSAATLTNYRSQ